jgi:AcrR family transcriptional regulator
MTKTVTSMPSPGKRELQKEARRIAIIDAALEEFTAQGFTATKLDDVAERADIGKGTIYLYFDSKESLFEEVVRRNLLGGEEMIENFIASFEGTTSELLAAHFRGMYQFMQNDKIPPLIAMVLGEALLLRRSDQAFAGTHATHHPARCRKRRVLQGSQRHLHPTPDCAGVDRRRIAIAVRRVCAARYACLCRATYRVHPARVESLICKEAACDKRARHCPHTSGRGFHVTFLSCNSRNSYAVLPSRSLRRSHLR